MSDWAGIGIGLALLLGNAFFVGAEFALISARRSQIEPEAQAGKRRAKLVLKGMERVSLMLAGAQLGITVCSIGLGAVAEPALAHLIEPLFVELGLPSEAAHAVAFVIALTIVVYLHVVLGEMVPKNLALATPLRSSLWLGPALWYLVMILRPFIAALNAIANLFLRLLRVPPTEEVAAAFTSDEVATLIQESEREGLLDDVEYELASGALELSERAAEELVIPAESLRTVRAADPAESVFAATMETGFSRFPVLGGAGRPIGYLHVRDVLRRSSGQSTRVGDMPLRPLPPVAADATAASVAEIMRNGGAHLAQVVHSSGEVVGIIALEDALEELIGEVRDSAHRG